MTRAVFNWKEEDLGGEKVGTETTDPYPAVESFRQFKKKIFVSSGKKGSQKKKGDKDTGKKAKVGGNL